MSRVESRAMYSLPRCLSILGHGISVTDSFTQTAGYRTGNFSLWFNPIIRAPDLHAPTCLGSEILLQLARARIVFVGVPSTLDC